MNSTFVTTLVRDITHTIANAYADRLASEIDIGLQDGRDTVDILRESFSKLLKELPITNTPVSTPMAVVGTSTSASTTVKSAAASADVLKDAHGNPILCSASTKAGAPCKNKAKFKAGEQHLCGLHAKSVLPATGSRPTASSTVAPAKAVSQFSSIVGLNSGGNFSGFSVDVDGVSSVDQDI